jgi:methanesulfonate monooxygenase small subunit
MSANLNGNRAVVEELIYESCMVMDERDFPSFMELCDPKFTYKLTAYSPEIKKDMAWLDHDRAEMEDLFNTQPKQNNDHSPLTRNAVVYKIDFDEAKKRANVVSALQIYRTLLNGGVTELFAVGKYYDTVSLSGNKPALLSRHVKLDTRDLGWGYHIPF